MVFFNCNACGEALKKNQVEKHYLSKCRQCSVLSCVDCGKDFWGDDYQQHTKCISEEEKYSGKDWKPKANFNKGEAKQEAWIQQVQSAIDKSSVNPRLQKLLEQMKDYPNIPRKKAKFENFLKNSLRIWDSNLVAQVWDILEKQAQEMYAKQQKEKEEAESKANKQTSDQQLSAESEDSNEKDNGTQKKLSKRERKEERRKEKNKQEKKDKHKNDKNEENGEEEKMARKKKRKRDDEGKEEVNDDEEDQNKKRKKMKKQKKQRDDDNEDGSKEENNVQLNGEEEEEDVTSVEERVGKFSWEAAIIGVLKAASDQEISVKKLKKKVLAEYNARGGDSKTKSEEKLWAKFEKKINKNPRLKVHKERVKLVS